MHTWGMCAIHKFMLLPCRNVKEALHVRLILMMESKNSIRYFRPFLQTYFDTLTDICYGAFESVFLPDV
jgi:hypothetical protein